MCSRGSGVLRIRWGGVGRFLNVSAALCRVSGICGDMGANCDAGLATYLMLWPEDGRMMKEDIRGIYDGSIFYTIAARREKRQ
jgi:hypothetical protein